MTILGIDTTGEVVSCAVMQEGVIIGSVYLNVDKKHAQTLMPLIDKLLNLTETDIIDINALTVAAGPGSFTGIRIGAACAEGIACGLNIPIYMVNTLDALLMNIAGEDAKCSLMDARRGEVYVKAVKADEVIIEASALPLSVVLDTLKGQKVIFNGDGALAYKEEILKMPESYVVKGQFCLQNAASLCECVKEGIAQKAEDATVIPQYLRMSQAERLKTEKTEKSI